MAVVSITKKPAIEVVQGDYVEYGNSSLLVESVKEYEEFVILHGLSWGQKNTPTLLKLFKSSIVDILEF